MKFDLEPGKYIVAVSGGVDSVALLHFLHSTFQLPASNFHFIVAHFDHGIRSDSQLDEQLVDEITKQFGLEFVSQKGELGVDASEAASRAARYAFLRNTKKQYAATAIITAHHQDDMIETMIINMMRGTGRKGLSSLRSTNEIIRPFLAITKKDILNYAIENKLTWREDSTNADTQYARNHIRAHVLPRFTTGQREQLLQHIHSSQRINQHLDVQLTHYLHIHPARDTLDRKLLAQLPHNVTKEVLASWLRSHGLRGFDAKTLERLAVAVKTAQIGVLVDVFAGCQLDMTNDNHIVLRTTGR
ncbi:tRNA lysidine(34) synthetase TilS [soil metagenome]